jgi:hypothetical protein
LRAVTGRWSRAAGVLAAALGCVGLARWDAAVTAVPALGLLRGPLATVFLVAALASVLPVRRLTRLERRLARLPSGILFAGAFVLFAAAGLYYSAHLHPSGDEPHYLLMAQSLAREADLDLRDNFARGDFREYVPDLAAPHYGAPRADGRPFPAHSPGLPLLLAPLYAVGGRRACVVLMALLAAACAAQVRALARQLGAGESAATFAFTVACGPPLFFYAFHVYTEVPSALAVALALRLLSGAAPGLAPALVAALCASALPWLHVKMIPAAAALGLVAAWRLRGRPRAAFLLVAGVAALGFVAYYETIFGRATPLGLYGGGVPRGVEPAPLRAAAGLLLDRSFGLLPYAPVFLLALAGVPALVGRISRPPASRERAAALAHVLVIVAMLAPVLAWRMWWGGMCPPARFLVPLVPSLASLVALRLGREGEDAACERGLARARFVLAALGAALAAIMIARPADLLLLNRRDRPTRVWAALAGHTPAGDVSLGDYLPSLVLPSAGDAGLAAFWLAGLAWVLVLDWRAGVSRCGVGRAATANGNGRS